MVKFKDIIFEENVAIHCPEEWMANELLKYADSKGYTWSVGDSYLECNEWNKYKEDTCYRIAAGLFYYLFGYEKEFEKDAVKILHYNNVVIKEENNMETSLDYELIIKGRKAEIGSRLYMAGSKCDKTFYEIEVNSIFLDKNEISISFKQTHGNVDKEWTLSDKEFNEIDNILFWEKPIIYQLPDTEGKLSEIKVGQEVFSESDTKMYINKLENNIIYVQWEDYSVYEYENITGENKMFYSIKTNKSKPKRDFSPYFDFNQAPNGFDYGAVDNDGNAWWFKDKPNQLVKCWNVDNYNFESAGFRQNLINPETGCVDDWKDSLVERPEGV